MTKIALFGLGYTGRYLIEMLSSESVQVEGYSRRTQLNQSHIFNAEKSEEVHNLKILWQNNAPAFAIITFPPEAVHPDFWTLLEETVPYRLLLGTTGSYGGVGEITESSDVISDHPRKIAEDRFVKAGGTLLRLSGIYGPGRDPVSWLLKSKQAAPQKQLNLIHIQDIGKFIGLWLKKPITGEVFNLSDGQNHSWGKIAEIAAARGIEPPSEFWERKFLENDNRFFNLEKVWKTYPNMDFVAFSESMEYQAFGD